MQLRQYQLEAIEKLKGTANSLLELQGNKTIVFEAPTGSGKTVIMAEFLKELVDNREDGRQFSFVWTAPRQLHTQSKQKLEGHYFDTKAMRCSNFEDLADMAIGENEILFLNWESINKADNIYIRENETDFNLSHIIANTVDRGRIVILIIDESHFGASTETSLGLIQMLQPKIAIDVSATPEIQRDELVKVYREKVIAEGMIKKQLALNPGFKNIVRQQRGTEIQILSGAAETTNELIIKVGLEKRQEQKATLEAFGSTVNPLMLIQLPDRRQGMEDMQQEVVRILKENHSVTTDNGRLAIYLSEDKANLDNITKNDGDVDVMIFKQAIALGWDCPRASILVLFRDWRSITFSIQTVGRILRMPELKHYDADELNIGIVYTNLSDIAIQEEIASSYLTINSSKRKPLYEDIALRSVHSKRFREETRLSPKFILDFLHAAKELKVAPRINTNVENVQTTLITDGLVSNLDKPFEHLSKNMDSFEEHSGATVQISQTEKEIQILFDLFVRDHLTPFAPEKRSIGRIKDSIYRFLLHEFPTMFEYGGIKAQMIVLSPANQQLFIDVINRAKEIYKQDIEHGQKELVVDEKWEVPKFMTFSNDYSLREVRLSASDPFFEAKGASGPEKEFVSYLESKTGEIDWWFKNGQRDGTYFAIPYVEYDVESPFYLDWIVHFKDGRIGLFDTKAGITAKDATAKAEGLAKYIETERKAGKNLFGGIVIWNGGSWRFNDKKTYKYNERDLTDWKFL